MLKIIPKPLPEPKRQAIEKLLKMPEFTAFREFIHSMECRHQAMAGDFLAQSVNNDAMKIEAEEEAEKANSYGKFLLMIQSIEDKSLELQHFEISTQLIKPE